MQQNNYEAAEIVYQKAQSVLPDSNKACNLGFCLMKQGRLDEAQQVLLDIVQRNFPGSEDGKVVNRAKELLKEIKTMQPTVLPFEISLSVEEEMMERLDLLLNEWIPFRSKRLPIFEEILRDQIAC
jgi:tetratricopeptide (TPR) repeat protein